METIICKLLNKDGVVLESAEGSKALYHAFQHTYQEGDRIEIRVPEGEALYHIQIDDVLGLETVWLSRREWSYEIPFGGERERFSPLTFSGDSHLISVKPADGYEVMGYRNLAKNRLDQRRESGCYPHVTANAETPKACFYALNAIDGCRANTSHGWWLHTAWGTARHPEPELRLDFGREVAVDRVVLYERADFPHDNWWKHVTLAFSNGSTVTANLEKTAEGQVISFPKKKISWLELRELHLADDPSPFPALSQLEVYGTEILEDL